MEPFFPAIWNVLHDGCIERIVGTVPGDIRVDVSIEYLRERFQDDGESIILTLSDCTIFSHRVYDEEQAVSDLNMIANESLSILSAEMNGAICQVFTDVGVLELKCESGSISLDSGRKISLKELFSVAENYWEEWASKSKRSK
jgi:hypothetical protein